MDNEIDTNNKPLAIDSQELLFRFIVSCQNSFEKNSLKYSLLSCADIVSAVHYYRKYPNVNEFINTYVRDKKDYFKIQWIRSTWATFSNMTEEELSNLIINQIILNAGSEE